ncbi:hypothetical protein CCR75_004249 [Bremia lactucae]|uniref:GPI ethanolamine phosphate transferase 3 n=1 Tax=Bremia lactucae TaxID=4779 RepID=A0A976FI64_BRELC|nr:hypothetical protein CCR75_004249 [Bremia lactucae]
MRFVMGHRILATILALHASALYLFTKGFFLTRFEVPDISSCQAFLSDKHKVVPHLRGDHENISSSNDGASEGCWMPRRFRRIVFVVIDALRFDFAAAGLETQHSEFYSDRLSILNDTITNEPGHALLFKFVADPPTMTMQRLKGLTTGSLPTFLDIKDNMARSNQIVEDNLLRQLRAQQRKIVFMGDDTWESLYAREFTRNFAFDSFNVKDLHSVDHGVTKHLFPELLKPDWDLLIAHYLGVDHVGHTHGPSSVYMADKLDEMNGILKRLIQTLKLMPDGEDVLLAVLGDHGMSADGNHGGASDDETGAALFLYSKSPLVAIGGANDKEATKELKEFTEKMLNSSREVPQVDLVPTLALLSGLPIPFGNLGSVIPSLFFKPSAISANEESSVLTAFQTLNLALRLNFDQVQRYLSRYSSASKLPKQAYTQLEKLVGDIKQIEQQLEQIRESKVNLTYLKADYPLELRLQQELAKQQQNYLREALSLGRSIWTQFDLCSMRWGILLLVWIFIIGAISIRLVSVHSQICWSPQLSAVALVGGLFYIFPARFNLPLLPAASASRGLVAGSCTGLINLTRHLVSEKGGAFASFQHSPTSTKPFMSSISATGVIATMIVVLHALSLLSNSYIVTESNTMQFLSATIGFFLLVCAQRTTPTRRAATGAAVAFISATRLSSALDPPNIIKASATLERTFAPLLAIATLAIGFSVHLTRSTGYKLSFVDRLIIASSTINYCLCAIFWAASPIAVSFWRQWLPRFVYLIFVGTLVCTLMSCARQAKQKRHHDLAEQRTIQHVFLLWQYIPAFMLVLGPTSPLSVLCQLVQYTSFLYVFTSCQSSSPSYEDITPWVVLWASCSYQTYFTSGHANTFTSLQNAAGFVGFDTFNFYIAGALLGLNTFGCFAIPILALPCFFIKQHQLQSGKATALLAFSTYFSVNALVSTVFVALQRRHLMVWAIFAPKFIFDGIVLLATEILLLVLLPMI